MALLVLIFCICLMQFGQGAPIEVDSDAQNILNDTRVINGGGKFIGDVTAILEKYQNNAYVVENLKTFVSVFSQGKSIFASR